MAGFNTPPGTTIFLTVSREKLGLGVQGPPAAATALRAGVAHTKHKHLIKNRFDQV